MYELTVGRYRETQILSESPGRILLMLYDGAIRASREAARAIQSRDYVAKAKAIDRAVAIISELSAGLRHELAPELCRNLELLYHYMVEQLTAASLKMDVAPVERVQRHLVDLRSSWAAAIEGESCEP
ncbi:MAG: flagellar export chaperone FliS [Deltaproteobacteria bacterium]|nr:flagellar export chaperone FliS [Deltaproteobacteria bacterium]